MSIRLLIALVIIFLHLNLSVASSNDHNSSPEPREYIWQCKFPESQHVFFMEGESGSSKAIHLHVYISQTDDKEVVNILFGSVSQDDFYVKERPNSVEYSFFKNNVSQLIFIRSSADDKGVYNASSLYNYVSPDRHSDKSDFVSRDISASAAVGTCIKGG